jgi:hypothetical protein
MKALYKGIAAVAFYLIAIGLMVYAALRSLHFIQMSLPADQQMLGYLGLLATSGGMIGWLLVFLHKAQGVGQRVTSFLMIGVCAAGEFGLFALDTLYVTGEAGLISQMTSDEIRMVLIALSGLIAINIAATVIYHIVEPENMREMKENFVKDRLEAEAMKIIEKRGEEIAREMAPKLADQWAREFEDRFKDIASLGIGQTAREKRNQASPSLNESLMPPLWFNSKKKSNGTGAAEELVSDDAIAIPASGNGKGHGSDFH